MNSGEEIYSPLLPSQAIILLKPPLLIALDGEMQIGCQEQPLPSVSTTQQRPASGQALRSVTAWKYQQLIGEPFS